jgi:hypothetical protein
VKVLETITPGKSRGENILSSAIAVLRRGRTSVDCDHGLTGLICIAELAGGSIRVAALPADEDYGGFAHS